MIKQKLLDVQNSSGPKFDPFHVSMFSNMCFINQALGKDKFEWGKLFDMWIDCKEDWMKCDLVVETSSQRAKEKLGRWRSMSKVVSCSQTRLFPCM